VPTLNEERNIAWVLERVAYRPLRKRGAPKLAFLISAIGASFFLSTLASKLFNSQTTNQFPPFFNAHAVLFTIGGADVQVMQVVIVVSALAMMVGLDFMVNRTKLGRGIRAVSEDAPTAALMGIDIDRTISRTFVIGGLLGGAAGFLFGIYFNFGFNMGFVPGVKAFAAAVLGGIGNVRGALLGGLLLGVIANYGQILLGDAQWADVETQLSLVDLVRRAWADGAVVGTLPFIVGMAVMAGAFVFAASRLRISTFGMRAFPIRAGRMRPGRSSVPTKRRGSRTASANQQRHGRSGAIRSARWISASTRRISRTGC